MLLKGVFKLPKDQSHEKLHFLFVPSAKKVASINPRPMQGGTSHISGAFDEYALDELNIVWN